MTEAPPKHRLPDGPLPPNTAYQVVHDELMLDGNARLNLATFVTTWMEPQAGVLMGECRDKNMIDKDEYPRTAELERRCVAILADLWNAPDPASTVGCSTTGSSEACMLAGMALKRRWMRRNADRYPGARPNLVMGVNVQVCWEKFCNFWEVEARQVPMEGDRFHLDPQAAAELCDENTIGVVGILGSTFDGSYEPIAELCAALDQLQERTGLDIPVHVDGASGAMIAPSSTRTWSGTSGCRGCPRSTHRATSTGWSTRASAGHCGGPRPSCPRSSSSGSTTWAATCRPSPQLLPSGRAGRGAVLHVPTAGPGWLPGRAADDQRPGPRARRAGRGAGGLPTLTRGDELPVFAFTTAPHVTSYDVFDVSRRMRESGWLVPAYTFPANREDLSVLRVVCRNGFSVDLADLFIEDLSRLVPQLRRLPHPLTQDKEAATGFHH